MLFYILGHAWMLLFGTVRLSLRLFSTAGFFVAISLLWSAARRFYALPVIAFAIGLVFFVPPPIVWQEFNGRFYGLFLASSAFASVVFLRTWGQERLSRRDCLLSALAHGCLVGSHILGAVYSGGMLSVLLGTDLLRHRFRRGLLLSVFAGGLVAMVSLHAIRASASVAQGGFWTTQPHVRDLLFSFFADDRRLIKVAVLISSVVLIRKLLPGSRSRGTDHLGVEPGSHSAIHALIAAFLLSQGVLFVKSHYGSSVYAERYLLPLSIATCFLFAELTAIATQGLRWRAVSWPVSSALSILILCLSARQAFSNDPYATIYPTPGFPNHVEAVLPPNHDVVVLQEPTFLVLRLYDPAHRYVFATDWKYLNSLPEVDTSGERLVENVARAGYTPHDVMDCPNLSSLASQFTMLVDPGHLAWFHDHLLGGGGFQAHQVNAYTEWWPMTVWSVERLTPNATCKS